MWKRITGFILFVGIVVCVVVWRTVLLNKKTTTIADNLEVDVLGQDVKTNAWDDLRKHRRKNVPTAMMELYRKGPHPLIPAEIVKSLTPTEIGTMQNSNQSFHEDCHSILFDVPGIIPGEDLHSAQLHLTVSFIDWKQELVVEYISKYKARTNNYLQKIYSNQL